MNIMHLYCVTTNNLRLLTDNHGRDVIRIDKDTMVYLQHPKQFTQDIFLDQLDEAYEQAKKKAPGRIRDIVEGGGLDVQLEHVMEMLCTLFHYEIVPLTASANLPKKVENQKILLTSCKK